MITKINFVPGDIVRVHERIKEGDPSAGSLQQSSGQAGQVKIRTQIFEGTVLGIRGRGENRSFKVRKLVGSVWVERIWPIISPNIEKVVVKEHSKKRIRRAKLYYLFDSK